MSFRHRIVAFSLLSAVLVVPAVFGLAAPAMAEDAPTEQKTAVVGESKTLKVTAPVDAKGDLVVAQHNDGTWWTTITVEYSGAVSAEAVTVERGGITVTSTPSYFLVASAQPVANGITSPKAFTKAMDSWDECRLDVARRGFAKATTRFELDEIEATTVFDGQIACENRFGLGRVLDPDDDGTSSFAFEFISTSPQTFTYEIPVGNIGVSPWVGINSVNVLHPPSYVEGASTTPEAAAVLQSELEQIGGASAYFPGDGGRFEWPAVYATVESVPIEVSVPATIAPLPGPKVERGTPMAPSGFSWLAPLEQSASGSPIVVDLSPVHITITALVGMVLIILVALPTQLLDSTLSANEGRIAQGIRRFLPSAAKRRVEELEQARLATEAQQAAAADSVAPAATEVETAQGEGERS